MYKFRKKWFLILMLPIRITYFYLTFDNGTIFFLQMKKYVQLVVVLYLFNSKASLKQMLVVGSRKGLKIASFLIERKKRYNWHSQTFDK